jgi:hypothetical protein
MTLGRPRETIDVLAPALRGAMEASNYYVTNADLHRALAEGFRAAGQADRAGVHDSWVRRAIAKVASRK